MSLRTQPLQIAVGLAHVEDDDFGDFAQHHTFLDQGSWDQLHIYDFPGEQQGEVAAMDLQIAFRPSAGWLQVVRARRPNSLFYEKDYMSY